MYSIQQIGLQVVVCSRVGVQQTDVQQAGRALDKCVASFCEALLCLAETTRATSAVEVVGGKEWV